MSAMGSMAKIGPCGGSGGIDKDMDMNGVNRIVGFIINHDLTINAVTILYERNGHEESTSRWGGTGGSRTEFRLAGDEYLTNIRGHVGMWENLISVVRSLTFVSNLHSYGPFGTEIDMPFQLPAVGGKILGFHGHAGDLLDAFGTYVKY